MKEELCHNGIMQSPLDAADRTILARLQADAHAKLETLAQAAGLSVATIQRRIARLRADGTIAGTVTLLDPARLGQGMTFVVAVEMERERPDQLDAFARAACAEPQVQQCHYVTGEGDFVLICTAKDMDDFEALTRRLFLGEPNVRRFRTSVAMRTYKRSLDLPVER
ncbi:Leucine-responsive regulatory protein [Roseivivax sp. THAF30]|nr:Leucine-responsive regulatory protein [Roseivivax sp. THAF30]